MAGGTASRRSFCCGSSSAIVRVELVAVEMMIMEKPSRQIEWLTRRNVLIGYCMYAACFSVVVLAVGIASKEMLILIFGFIFVLIVGVFTAIAYHLISYFLNR